MTNTTISELFAPVREAISDAHLVAWDGCHKIFLAMDEIEAEWFIDSYPHAIQAGPEIMLTFVMNWYERSCPLRFVNAVWHDEDDPNAGFTTLIPQFADDQE